MTSWCTGQALLYNTKSLSEMITLFHSLKCCDLLFASWNPTGTEWDRPAFCDSLVQQHHYKKPSTQFKCLNGSNYSDWAENTYKITLFLRHVRLCVIGFRFSIHSTVHESITQSHDLKQLLHPNMNKHCTAVVRTYSMCYLYVNMFVSCLFSCSQSLSCLWTGWIQWSLFCLMNTLRK